MKTAVITGATSGIGNSILKEFLKDGYTVFAGYRDIRQKKDLTMLSDNVIPFRIDLTKKWTIEEAIKTINNSAESIDVLVNVAGKVVAGPLETLPVNKIREQFEVNVFSHLELSQGLFEKLNGGKIINISSMASYGMFPFLAPYCASKKTMDMLFNSLRIETGSKVKIISVKPGVISTPLWQKSIDENKENLGDGKYKVVSDFLISNAIKNSTNGLNPNVVAKKVLKIAQSNNPKNSYVIGFDALAVQMLSKLPQKFVDIIVETQLVKRVKEQLKEVLLMPNTSPVSESDEVEHFYSKPLITEPVYEEPVNEEPVNEEPVNVTLPEMVVEQLPQEEKIKEPETIQEIYEMGKEHPEDKLQNALEDAIESNKPRKKRTTKSRSPRAKTKKS